MSIVSQITIVSGASTVTVASGQATLFAIIPNQLSGGTTTYSGQTIRVLHATSGMTAVASGQVIYNYDFGIQSGLSNNGQVSPRPEALTDITVTCLSGIVVLGATNYYVTIVYSK